ncbi:SRPBCC family protein [Jiulongibacter sp. NS-SX5]|uniref:SRPBCC family protein n=1 Tax=Jiulongibacter sp. NS-SX5 TaxID=3463854 RepID=UPI004058500A
MITFRKHSGIYTLEAESELPISLEQAWDYFSSPKNLAEITPPHMGFKITSKPFEKAFSGQIISYNVGVLPGIRTNWVTEITHVEDQKFFVDEQRFGPYRMWHHEHHFEAKGSGVYMMDRVSFKIPLGFLGDIAYALFIKKQLKGIFEYREEKLKEVFK